MRDTATLVKNSVRQRRQLVAETAEGAEWIRSPMPFFDAEYFLYSRFRSGIQVPLESVARVGQAPWIHAGPLCRDPDSKREHVNQCWIHVEDRSRNETILSTGHVHPTSSGRGGAGLCVLLLLRAASRLSSYGDSWIMLG